LIHFIIPLYNKENTLSKNINHLNEFLKLYLKQKYEIILSDDGSTDNTLAVAQSLEESLPRVRVVGYSCNRGRGYAIKYAAKSTKGKYIIFADLDFPQTTSLTRILEMADSLKKNQVVIGSRFLPESSTKRFLTRSLVSRAHRLLLKLIFPWVGIKDPDVGFKGFQTSSFHRINKLSKMNRWSWDLEVIVIAQKNHLRMVEIPIDWNEKHTSYTSAVNIFRASLEELKGMLQIKKSLKKSYYEFKNKVKE